MPYDGCKDYASFYDPDHTDNWGIASITVGRIYGNLTFVLSEDVTLPAISGGGVEVTFAAMESAASNMTKSFTRGLRHDTFVTLFENMSLDDIVPSGAEGASGFERSPTYNETGIIADTIVRGETSGVKWMKFEIQNKGSYSDTADIVRSAYISLKQNGNNVDGKLLGFSYVRSDKNRELYNSAYGNAIFESTGGADGFSRKSGFSSYLNYYDDGTTSNGWGIKSLTVAPREYTVTAGAENTMAGSSYVIRGSDTCAIVFKCDNTKALPAGDVDVYGEGTTLAVASSLNNTVHTITMHSGTVIKPAGNYVNGSQRVVLDAATWNADKFCIGNNITLSNGATIAGSNQIRAGGNAATKTWTIEGTGASMCSTMLVIQNQTGGASVLTIDVEDTVEGADADFIVTGDIASHASSYNMSFVKTGPGTMQVDGSLTLSNAVRVAEGTLLLNKSNGLAANGSFSLEGGTLALAENVADACKSMSVTEDSALDLAAGASITLGTVTVAESKTLSITAADGAKVKVNGTLDAATLSRIRLNGHRVAQNGDGYLGTPGFMLVIY